MVGGGHRGWPMMTQSGGTPMVPGGHGGSSHSGKTPTVGGGHSTQMTESQVRSSEKSMATPSVPAGRMALLMAGLEAK